MKNQSKYITVFEHQTVKLHQLIDGVEFDEAMLKALQCYYGKGVPYFTLIHNGIRFNEYVGVIQVGNTVFEVLPKADSTISGTNEKAQWRDMLIKMLSVVGTFDIHAPSNTSLQLKSNSILDLYFELFLKEVEYLLHIGLVKRYRKKEGNVTALKGSLQFGKHLQQNLTHQERFYVRHTTYDVEHKLHFILYKAILLLKQINTNSSLHSRIGALLLNFPEMPDIAISETTFNKLTYNRKTQSYKKAIDIARLLLLHYHPDVSKGKNHVLALMFDMNMLWEQFIFTSLRIKKGHGTTIEAQSQKYFWKPENGSRSKIIPDIVINKGMDNCVILDTKWKNLNGYNPSPDDLRQMYVYHEYYEAKKVALIYPGVGSVQTNGKFIDAKGNLSDKECSVICLSVKNDMRMWQESIYTQIHTWMNPV